MPADAVRIEAQPANVAIVMLVGDGRPARPGDPYAIDGWELRAHPDLEERLRALAAGLPGAVVAGYRGWPVVVDGEAVVRALATGTSGLLLRLPDGPARDEVLVHGGAPRPDLGPAWISADPWLSDVPSAAGTALLRAWLRAAVGEPG